MTFIEKELAKYREKFPKGTKARLCSCSWFVSGAEVVVRDIICEWTEYNQYVIRAEIGWAHITIPVRALRLLSDCDKCPHRMYPLLGKRCPNGKKES